MEVGRDYKGKGLGLGKMALKAYLAILHERGLNHIILKTVAKNGINFWPHMGSLPIVNFMRPKLCIASLLKEFLERYDKKHKVVAKKDREKFIQECSNSPYHAWKYLSQLKAMVCMEGEREVSVYKTVFSFLPDFEDHILLPGEPNTRKVLEKHLGVIPPFRDVSNTYAKEFVEEIKGRRSVKAHNAFLLPQL